MHALSQWLLLTLREGLDVDCEVKARVHTVMPYLSLHKQIARRWPIVILSGLCAVIHCLHGNWLLARCACGRSGVRGKINCWIPPTALQTNSSTNKGNETAPGAFWCLCILCFLPLTLPGHVVWRWDGICAVQGHSELSIYNDCLQKSLHLQNTNFF